VRRRDRRPAFRARQAAAGRSHRRRTHYPRGVANTGAGIGRLVVISGPTGTGKSDLALELAERVDGEVVNADSMQLYRGMDIGTAKLAPAERRGVPHHLLDVLD